jgi:hypothetical protein
MNIFEFLNKSSSISYGEICFDIQVLWITSTFPERIMLASQGTTVFTFFHVNEVCEYVMKHISFEFFFLLFFLQ